MKLYNLPAGVNPRRVRIFIAEKGLDIPMVDVDMMKGENKTAEYLAINPMGKMPVLALDDGTNISESMAICRYLEELHPEPNMFGRDALERAKIEMWNRRMELDLMLPAIGFFRHTHEFWKDREPQVPEYGQLCAEQVRARMDWLDAELGTREFIAADRYTVADITAQCALIVAKFCGIRIAESQPNLARWFEQVTARPTARA